MKTITQKTYLFLVIMGISTSFISCRQGDKNQDVDNDAQEQTLTSEASTGDNDTSFLAEVTAINLEEIELGKLAQNRATSQEVKEFGKMMVDGHTKSLNELKVLISNNGTALPEEISQEGKETIAELTQVDAKEFEKRYMAKMVDGHKETIQKFEDASDDVKDAALKAWALKALPDLRMHLEHAVTVQQKVN